MVNSKLKQSFHIIIEFTSGKAYFRLCLDMTLWLSLKGIELHIDLRSIKITRYHKDHKNSKIKEGETHMLE